MIIEGLEALLKKLNCTVNNQARQETEFYQVKSTNNPM